MTTIKNIYLVTRNARGKVQQVRLGLFQDGTSFTITRETGQHGGKLTDQPNIEIHEGKAKRSVLEQAELQFNSYLKKYQDRGYKIIGELSNKKFENISIEEMDQIVPSIKTDASGFYKPMLAKDSNSCQPSVLNKTLYCSTKLDGVRSMFQLKDGDIKAVSRGGNEYLEPTKLIKQDLVQFFKDYPDIILDGEIYVHGHHLQEISGMVRKHEWTDKCAILEYHIYDIGDATKTFKERLEFLKTLQEYFKDSTKIKVLDHVKTESYNEIKKLHDKWVSEGYEGLVARKPDKKYGFGKRGSDMIKVKEYQEDEFEIIDYKEGLRDEDFVFVCETKDGKLFEAKPMGDRALKAQYIEDIDIIIGKMGTVKFFDWSKDNIPMQPVFKTIRDYE